VTFRRYPAESPRPASKLSQTLDTPNDSPKWGNVIVTAEGLQNGPRCSLRVTNFNDERCLPYTHTILLSYQAIGGEALDFYDIHPIAKIATGTGAGSTQFEVDWVHGTQLVFPISSGHVDLSFDAPLNADSVIPKNLKFGAFLGPSGSPGAVRPVRSFRLPSLLAAASTDIPLPLMVRRVRVYATVPTALAGAVQSLFAGPTLLAAEVAGSPMDIFGPAQTYRLTAGAAALTNPYVVFEVAA
jgi:hypothetical protein